MRAGDESSLLLFVKARNDESFANVVFRSRIKDWLHGVRQIQPIRQTVDTLTQTPLTEAERQRMIYGLITSTREDGGAGITPGHGDWKNVEAVVPLHDHERNKRWLTEFSSKTFLTPQDLDDVRDCVGEKVSVDREKYEPELTFSDCLLLRLSADLLPIFDLSGRLRLFCLGSAWELFGVVHGGQWLLVHHVC